MHPHPAAPSIMFPSENVMKRLLGAMSIFTLVMTVPQILIIWLRQEAAGVSLFSWGAYFVSALIWFWYGVQRRDRNIYIPCVGWILLDGAVIIGTVVYG